VNTLAFNTLLLVKHNSSEWHRMWSKLAKHRSNRALQEPAVADNDGKSGSTWRQWKNAFCGLENATSIVSVIVITQPAVAP